MVIRLSMENSVDIAMDRIRPTSIWSMQSADRTFSLAREKDHVPLVSSGQLVAACRSGAAENQLRDALQGLHRPSTRRSINVVHTLRR